ncbi:alpha/beta hydrolase [Williamwhitmania taraxaci]|uniref:Serine aminopeptidase S33 domain-containing protein n=1 Tax=Williamwhitmania taraxaci TaxID=1640674 RepID=A0A1G6T760_9BACT|nr:alpha/beta hydrolase [Williamwhitmania taraxaci]SDD24920.1 hypothetical protein SAMN05216323_11147 [Williamwhitmania taraxaci]
MKNIKSRIVLGIIYSIAFIGLFYLCIGCYFAYVAVGNFNLTTFVTTFEKQRADSTFDVARWDTLVKHDINLKSDFGYSVNGMFVENGTPSDTTVVICHGVACNKWLMIRYADLYLSLGYNVVLYDQRGHGVSGGEYSTFGYTEKFDLQKMVELVAEQHLGVVIGAHGESMGAATVLLHAGMINAHTPDSLPHISFYIADCPYSDLKKQLTYRLKEEYHIPNIGIVEAASLWSHWLYGFWFGEVNPIAHIQDVKVPVLFIHGDADTYVPTSMSEEFYSAKPEPKMLYLSPNANHAMSYRVNKDEYRSRVETFRSRFLGQRNL